MDTLNPLRPAPPAWYRQPLVWLIIAIPASSVVVGVLMLVLSIRTYDGLVVDDYYKRGLMINRSLARDQRALDLGLAASLEVDLRGTRVQLSSSAGEFVPPPRLSLAFSHSTRPGLDRQVLLEARSPGRYAGPPVELAPGRWYLELSGEQWRLTDSLSGGAPRSVTLGRK